MDKLVEYDDYKSAADDGKCSLCKNYYNEHERVPRRCPCFHVFCENCIADLKFEKIIVCPIRDCKSEFYLDEKPIHEFLPIDECAVAIASHSTIQNEPENVKCKGCPENAHASCFCLDCKYCLCAECARAHKRDLTSRDHKPVPLSEVKNIDRNVFCMMPKCGTHEQKPRNYYCNTSGCKQLICHECIFDHPKQEHDVQKVKDAYPGCQEKIGGHVEQVVEKLNQIQGGIENVNKEIECVIQKKTELTEFVTATYSNYKAILDWQKSGICDRIADFSKLKTDVLEIHYEELKKLEMITKTLIHYSEVSADYTNQAIFLEIASEVEKKLQQIAQTQIQDDPKAKATLRYEHIKTFSDFTRYSKYLGQLQNDMSEAEKEKMPSSYLEQETIDVSTIKDDQDALIIERQQEQIRLLETTVKELTEQCLDKEQICQESFSKIKALEEKFAVSQQEVKSNNQDFAQNTEKSNDKTSTDAQSARRLGGTLTLHERESLSPTVREDDFSQQNTMLAKLLSDIGNQPSCQQVSNPQLKGPEQVARRMRDLYDTTWTDVFEALNLEGKDDRDIITMLLSILKDCYEVSRSIRQLFPSEVKYLLDTVSSNRPSGAANMTGDGNEFTEGYVVQTCLDKQIEKFHTVYKDVPFGDGIAKYIAECAEICWAMNLHTPPIELLVDAGDEFNPNLLAEYTKKGTYISYMVWPALVQFQYPRLWTKGFAQGRKTKPKS